MDEIAKVQDVKKLLSESVSNESYDSTDFDEMYKNLKASKEQQKPAKSDESKSGSGASKAKSGSIKDAVVKDPVKNIKVDPKAKLNAPSKLIDSKSRKSKDSGSESSELKVKPSKSKAKPSGLLGKVVGAVTDIVKDTVAPRRKTSKSKGDSKPILDNPETGKPRRHDSGVSPVDSGKKDSDKKKNHHHNHHHRHDSDSSESYEIPMCQLEDGNVIHSDHGHHGHHDHHGHHHGHGK